MLQKTTGVVLRAFKYNDTSIIADVYTREVGRVSYLVPLPKSKKGGVKGVFFQPLSLVGYESDYRARLRLQRLREVQPLCLFRSLPYDPYKTAIALFLAEFLTGALKEEGENPVLFDYLRYSVEWLDACAACPANFHLVFLMHFSRFLGLYPNLEQYHPGDCFDLRGACFVSGVPSHADYVRPDEAARLTLLMRMNYDTMHLFGMNRTERNRFLDMILEYYRLHLPDFRPLKSLEVLKELFA